MSLPFLLNCYLQLLSKYSKFSFGKKSGRLLGYLTTHIEFRKVMFNINDHNTEHKNYTDLYLPKHYIPTHNKAFFIFQSRSNILWTLKHRVMLQNPVPHDLIFHLEFLSSRIHSTEPPRKHKKRNIALTRARARLNETL